MCKSEAKHVNRKVPSHDNSPHTRDCITACFHTNIFRLSGASTRIALNCKYHDQMVALKILKGLVMA